MPDTNTALAKRENGNALEQPRHRQTTAIVPQSYEELERFSKTVARSNLVPSNFKNKPQDVMVAVMHGLEIGLKPLQSLQNIAVINGKPSIYGDAALALVRSSDVCEYVKEWRDKKAAYCEVKRKGEEKQVRSFSIAEAKKANLWGKRGPWTDYPQRMLQMRARSWALRDVFPDVLAGLYIAEEAQDIPTDDSAGGKASDDVEDAEYEPVDERPITTKQRKRLFAIAKNEGDYTDQGLKRLIGEHGYESTKDITRDDYDRIVEDARSKELAAKFNRDPNTKDLFEEDAEDEGEAEHDFAAAISQFKVDLEEAFPQGSEAVNAVATAFMEKASSWPQDWKDEAHLVYQETLEALQTESKASAAESMLEGKTAIPKEEPEESKGLPSDFPAREQLEAAGLSTLEAVSAAAEDGAIEEIERIGPVTRGQIKNYLEDLPGDNFGAERDGGELPY